jgi:hypothetical protein
VHQRHRRDCIAVVVSTALKLGDNDTDRYCDIVHIEQGGERKEELAEGRPLPLPPKLQDIVREESGRGKARGRCMRSSRGSGEGTSERAARHGATQSLSF